MLEQKIDLLTEAVEKLTRAILDQEKKVPEPVAGKVSQKPIKEKNSDSPITLPKTDEKKPEPAKETEYDLDALFGAEEEKEAPRFTDMASFSRYLAPIFMKLSDEKKGIIMDTISKNFGVTKLALLDEKNFNFVADLVETLANQ